MIEYIKNGGNFSKESPGAPVAFTLTRLSNNEIFNVVNGTEFVARKCKSMKGSVLPLYFYGIEGDNDVYGVVTAQLFYEGENYFSDVVYFFNKTRDNAVKVETGKKIQVDGSEEVEFNLDYSKLDKAYIRIIFDLRDADKNQDNDGATTKNDEDYVVDGGQYKCVVDINLKEYQEKTGRYYTEDGIIIPLHYDDDNEIWYEYEHSTLFRHSSTEKKSKYFLSKIKFAFKINL